MHLAYVHVGYLWSFFHEIISFDALSDFESFIDTENSDDNGSVRVNHRSIHTGQFNLFYVFNLEC